MQFYEEKIEKKSIFRMCSRTALYFKYFVCIFFQLELNFTFCKCKALFSNLSVGHNMSYNSELALRPLTAPSSCWEKEQLHFVSNSPRNLNPSPGSSAQPTQLFIRKLKGFGGGNCYHCSIESTENTGSIYHNMAQWSDCQGLANSGPYC